MLILLLHASDGGRHGVGFGILGLEMRELRVQEREASGKLALQMQVYRVELGPERVLQGLKALQRLRILILQLLLTGRRGIALALC